MALKAANLIMKQFLMDRQFANVPERRTGNKKKNIWSGLNRKKNNAIFMHT